MGTLKKNFSDLNLSVYHEELEKEKQTKPKASIRKD